MSTPDVVDRVNTAELQRTIEANELSISQSRRSEHWQHLRIAGNL